MTISDGLWHWVLGGAITLIGVFFSENHRTIHGGFTGI